MVKITARNFDLTEGIKGYTENRLAKFTKFTEEGNIQVVLENNRYGNKVEVSFKVNNKPVRASAIDSDLYAAIDIVTDKLSTITNRSMKKRLGKKSTSIKHIDSAGINGDLEAEGQSLIVKRKKVNAKPMFEEEAIDQMELLDHKSFIFQNATTNKVSMLYKRHDGDYGIVEMP